MMIDYALHEAHQLIQRELDNAYFAEWLCHQARLDLVTFDEKSHTVRVKDNSAVPQPILRHVYDWQITNEITCYTTHHYGKLGVKFCFRCLASQNTRNNTLPNELKAQPDSHIASQ